MKTNNNNDMLHQEEHQEQVDQQESVESFLNQSTELEACQQQVALWKDQAARVFADFDNYKKRMDREQIQWMQTAQTMVLKDLLSVIDNFDRALQAKTAENAALYAGIEMIYKSVMQVMGKYGVVEFTEYATFDPEKHEALMTVESADHASGNIVQVLEKGFMVKDKVLRPAKVTIAQ